MAKRPGRKQAELAFRTGKVCKVVEWRRDRQLVSGERATILVEMLRLVEMSNGNLLIRVRCLGGDAVLDIRPDMIVPFAGGDDEQFFWDNAAREYRREWSR